MPPRPTTLAYYGRIRTLRERKISVAVFNKPQLHNIQCRVQTRTARAIFAAVKPTQALTTLRSGTKLFLRIQPFCNSGGTTATTKCPQKWTWDPVINSYPEIAYKLAADNTTVMHTEGNVSASAVSMPILCGTTSFKSGQHRWRVSFTNVRAYCGFGLISQSERDHLRTKDFGVNFSSYPLFQKFYNALVCHQDAEYTFILYMDNRKCTVKAGSRLNITIKDLPSEVWPAVCIKRNGSQCIGKVYFD